MKLTSKLGLLALLILPIAVAAQAPDFISMDQEPHHHLSLKNDYVKVFKVEVNPGDSILMHRHDGDTVAIAIGDQMVSIGYPDKPDVHQKNPDGQLRLQKSGYIHSTHVDTGTAYHTVAVELLHAQSNSRNLCATVIAGLPLNCPEKPAGAPSAKYVGQPQFESDQTRVQIVRVPPGKNVTIGDLKYFQMIVALDPASLSPASKKGHDQALVPGNFVWFVNGGPSRVFKNNGKSEARFIEFEFNPEVPKGK
jgi:hypothetical protein